jgi:ketosteroid isomerase-like protein
MKADAKTGSEVRNAIAIMADHYKSRNLAGLMACFAPDDDVALIGTGADEKRSGRAEIEAQAKRDWQQTEALAMRFNDIAVSAAGNVAWACTDGAFEIEAGGQEMTLPARVTLVLERRGGAWLIVQAHFSAPFSGQSEGQSAPQ